MGRSLQSSRTARLDGSSSSLALVLLARPPFQTAGATRGVFALQDEEKQWRIELGASVDNDEPFEVYSSPEPTPTGSTGKTSAASSIAPPSILDQLNQTEYRMAPVGDGSATGSPTPLAAIQLSLAGVRSPLVTCSDGSTRSDRRLNKGLTRISGQVSISVAEALPASVFQHVLHSGEPLLLVDPLHQLLSRGDPYFESVRHRPRAILCMPILQANEVSGMLYLEHDTNSGAFTSSHVQLLQLLCGQGASARVACLRSRLD